MSKINLLTLQSGDSQSTLIDKINYNNDQFLTAGGGPVGLPGRSGATGPLGPQGIQGAAGPQGQPGNRWYVQESAPPPSTGGSTLGMPLLNDYWLRTSDKEIFIYGPSGDSLSWIDTTKSLSSLQLFNNIGSNYNVSSSSYDSDIVYYQNEDPQNFSMVLSDWGINSFLSYTGYTGFGLNSEKSKFKIATDFGSEYGNLISVGRVALDSANSSDSTFSNTHNPSIRWTQAGVTGTTAGAPNIWDLQLYNPAGNLDIISVPGYIGLTSNFNNITSTNATGGTVISFSPANGFFQVLPSGSFEYSTNPYFSTNSTGVGIKTNATANSLTVKGGVSISQSDTFNSYAFPLGVLGVEQGLRVGATGYNSYNLPVGVTGPTPLVLFSGQGNGAVYQARIDTPGGTSNAWTSWGNNSIYNNSSSLNVLTQEYAISSTGSVSPGTTIAGYYHGAGNANYSSIDPTQFKIETTYSSGTNITTANFGKYLNLNSSPSTTGGTESVLIGGGGNIAMQVFPNYFSGPTGSPTGGPMSPAGVYGKGYTGGIRINPSSNAPLINYTQFSVEGGGAYFGPITSTPDTTNTYVTSNGLNGSMGYLSNIKVTTLGTNDYNGINIESLTRISSGIPPLNPNTPKAIAINNNFKGFGGITTNTLYWAVGFGGQTVIGAPSGFTGSSGWGPNLTGTGAQLFVHGDTTIDGGTLRTVNTPIVYSARRFKDSIQPLSSSLDLIDSLNPVSFSWKKDGKEDIGFIAEEIDEILPMITDKDSEGIHYGYSPISLIPILTKGIQELFAEVKLLKEEIKNLKSK